MVVRLGGQVQLAQLRVDDLQVLVHEMGDGGLARSNGGLARGDGRLATLQLRRGHASSQGPSPGRLCSDAGHTSHAGRTPNTIVIPANDTCSSLVIWGRPLLGTLAGTVFNLSQFLKQKGMKLVHQIADWTLSLLARVFIRAGPTALDMMVYLSSGFSTFSTRV